MAESTPYLLPNTQGRYVTVPVTNTSGEVYRINDDGTRTIYGDYFVENGNTVLVSSTFASQEFQNNLAQSPQGYNSTISNSIIQASGGTTTAPTPNPLSLIGPIIKRSLFPVLIVECSRPSLKICASPALIE